MESAKLSLWKTPQDKRPSFSILKNHNIRGEKNMEEETIKTELKDKIFVPHSYICVINHSKMSFLSNNNISFAFRLVIREGLSRTVHLYLCFIQSAGMA